MKLNAQWRTVCTVWMAGMIGLVGVATMAADRQTGVALPKLTAQERLFATTLDVMDAPDGIGDQSPSRVVAQIIDYVFYQWAEYDLVIDNKTGFCVYLQAPRRAALSREEAQTLLAASRRWLEQAPVSPEYTELDANDPRLDVPPRMPALFEEPPVTDMVIEEDVSKRLDTGKPLSGEAPVVDATMTVFPSTVIGTDDRVRVTNTTNFPWNTICYMGMSFASGNYRGSAGLISPYCALTCAHNVYEQSSSTWASNVLIAAGQRQDTAGGTVIRPYGTRNSFRLRGNSVYVKSNGGFEYDYAAVHFETPFTGISTFMPLLFDHIPEFINLAGYPRVVRGESNSQGMWHSADPVVGVAGANDRILRYLADTSGGNSGGPVWRYIAPDTRHIVAIHVAGSTDYNLGARLVSQNQHIVVPWMQWTPATPSPANHTFTNATPIAESVGSTNGTNEGATKEPGEPDHAGNAGGQSVWWRWTAPDTGEVTIDTFDSDFDTLLAAYEGVAVDSLTTVASNDDADGTFQSQIVFDAVHGVTYHIAVDGYNGAFGNIALQWKMIKEYSVILDRQGGSGGSGSVTATYGSPMPPAIAPMKTGYTFAGYFDQPGGGGARYYHASMASARDWDKAADATLYAYWKQFAGLLIRMR